MVAVQPQFTFPYTYQIELLDRLPMLIEEPRQFFFPREVEEVERGALIVRVRPNGGVRWIGTFARGFDSEKAITGLFTTPHPDWLCVVCGGYGYVVNTKHPEQWHLVKARPILEIRTAESAGCLIFADFQTVSGFTSEGILWQSAPLSWEGLKITVIKDDELQGLGWDAMQDRETPFTVNLQTGEHKGGAAAKVVQRP